MIDERFKRAEDDYYRLKGQLAAGRITQEQFQTALKELMLQDAQNRWWMLGVDTGKWFVNDGKNWVESQPPSTGVPGPEPQPQLPPARADVPPSPKPPAVRRNVVGIGAAILVACCLVCGVAGVASSYLNASDPLQSWSRGWEEGARQSRSLLSTTTPATCPTTVAERHKCPWTPDGYAVEACGPGFCWDGGPQGALACKQEKGVPNSHRTYTSDLACDDTYTAERDRCTNVILRCVKK